MMNVENPSAIGKTIQMPVESIESREINAHSEMAACHETCIPSKGVGRIRACVRRGQLYKIPRMPKMINEKTKIDLHPFERTVRIRIRAAMREY